MFTWYQCYFISPFLHDFVRLNFILLYKLALHLTWCMIWLLKEKMGKSLKGTIRLRHIWLDLKFFTNKNSGEEGILVVNLTSCMVSLEQLTKRIKCLKVLFFSAPLSLGAKNLRWKICIWCTSIINSSKKRY